MFSLSLSLLCDALVSLGGLYLVWWAFRGLGRVTEKVRDELGDGRYLDEEPMGKERK